MSFTLGDLTYQVARALGVVQEGIVSSGSTTTIVDSNDRKEVAGFWEDGTAWITYDAGGAGAAPEDEFSVVEKYTVNTLTLRVALSTAPAANDLYAVADKTYPLRVLIQKVNEAIQKTGPLEITDITTITTADEQTEYNLPSGLLELREAWLQTNDDANDNKWEKLYDWYVQKSASGTANKLVLRLQPDTTYDIKLVYLGFHSVLRSYSNALDESIHPDLIVYNAVMGCLAWRMAQGKETEASMASLQGLLAYYQGLVSQVNAIRSVILPGKTAKTIDLVFDEP